MIGKGKKMHTVCVRFVAVATKQSTQNAKCILSAYFLARLFSTTHSFSKFACLFSATHSLKFFRLFSAIYFLIFPFVPFHSFFKIFINF